MKLSLETGCINELSALDKYLNRRQPSPIAILQSVRAVLVFSVVR